MKLALLFFLALSLLCLWTDAAVHTGQLHSQKNPLGAVLKLLAKLEAKVKADKEEEIETYGKYETNCLKVEAEYKAAIEAGEADEEKLTAKISEMESKIQVSDSEIETLAAAIATAASNIKSATEERSGERKTFADSEKELVATVDTLERAGKLLAKQLKKNPASLAQIDTRSMGGLVKTFSLLVEAAGLSGEDHERLVALVQDRRAGSKLGWVVTDVDEDDGCPTIASDDSHWDYYHVQAGYQCHFPFRWQGKVYKECTEDGSPGQAWCDVDPSGKWGFCDMTIARCLKAPPPSAGDPVPDPSDPEIPEALRKPVAVVHKTRSGEIVNILANLKDKAVAELKKRRGEERDAEHTFLLQKQLWEAQSKDSKELMDAEKDKKAAAMEKKAKSEGELAGTQQGLAESRSAKYSSNVDCSRKAKDHATSIDGYDAELKALADATKVLKEKTSGAVDQTYSMLQIQIESTKRSQVELVNFEVVTLVKRLAKEQHSAALYQLASRIDAVMKFSSHSPADPLAKVRGLIYDLITKLEREAALELENKQYCDLEHEKAKANLDRLQDRLDGYTSQIDTFTSAVTTLEAKIQLLTKEIAELASGKVELQKLRSAEMADYQKAKADLSQGLEGVREALAVLREYYGSGTYAGAESSSYEKSTAAGSTIINVLEVCESDFAKDLSAKDSAEADAQTAFNKEIKNNDDLSATKLKAKAHAAGELVYTKKSIAEAKTQKESTEKELKGATDYLDGLKDECTVQPESYEEKKAHRTAEIAGLKEALAILESSDVSISIKGSNLLQRSNRNKRGLNKHQPVHRE